MPRHLRANACHLCSESARKTGTELDAVEPRRAELGAGGDWKCPCIGDRLGGGWDGGAIAVGSSVRWRAAATRPISSRCPCFAYRHLRRSARDWNRGSRDWNTGSRDWNCTGVCNNPASGQEQRPRGLRPTQGFRPTRGLHPTRHLLQEPHPYNHPQPTLAVLPPRRPCLIRA